MTRLAIRGCVGALMVGALMSAQAATINVDEKTYQNGTGLVPGSLSAVVTMSYSGGVSGGVLTVDLQNTSALMPDLTAGGLGELAGIAFNLPSGVSITGGSAGVASGSTLVGGSLADMNAQWGYASTSGTLSGGAFAFFNNTYNATGATLTSDTDHSFAAGGNVDGLNYGAVSTAQAGGTVPGHPYVVDTVELTFNLSGTIPSDLLDQINNGSVGVMFGSPDTGGGSVPDGGTTLTLLGFAMVGIESLRRKLTKA